MNKIKKTSHFFRVIFQIGFIIFLIMPFIFWSQTTLSWSFNGFFLSFMPQNIPILHSLTTTDKFYGFLISWIPNTFDLLAIYFLIKLFSNYEKGEIFSFTTVSYFKKIGCVFLIKQITSPFSEALMSFALTHGNPVGKREVTISFGIDNIHYLIISAFLILISWIMAEAMKIKEEQILTV